MLKNYQNIIIAGFNQLNQKKLTNLLDQINKQTNGFTLDYKSYPIDSINPIDPINPVNSTNSIKNYPDLINIINNNSFDVCILDANLEIYTNHKLTEELRSHIEIKNKNTVLILVNSVNNIKNKNSNLLNNQDNTKNTNNYNNNTDYLVNLFNINPNQINLCPVNLTELTPYWLNFCINTAINNLNLQKEIKRLAHYDKLTNLVNRNLYLNQLNHALALADRLNQSCVLIYLDINNFKNINQKYGLKIGDLILIELSNRIKKSIRSTDLAGRLGSDEFAILIENCSEDEAKHIINNLSEAMEMPFNIQKSKIDVCCSIDYAIYPNQCEDITSFINNLRKTHYSTKS